MVVTHAQYDKNKTLLKILCNKELKECDVGTLSLEEIIRIVLSEHIAVKIGTIISIQDFIFEVKSFFWQIKTYFVAREPCLEFIWNFVKMRSLLFENILKS